MTRQRFQALPPHPLTRTAAAGSSQTPRKSSQCALQERESRCSHKARTKLSHPRTETAQAQQTRGGVHGSPSLDLALHCFRWAPVLSQYTVLSAAQLLPSQFECGGKWGVGVRGDVWSWSVCGARCTDGGSGTQGSMGGCRVLLLGRDSTR